jgi:hypothetical protein
MTNEQQNSQIRVECYAGQRADEEPRRFFIGEREVEISEVIDRWLDPAHRYFKVRGGDGGVYILRYDLDLNRWALTMYDSGSRDDTRLSST